MNAENRPDPSPVVTRNVRLPCPLIASGPADLPVAEHAQAAAIEQQVRAWATGQTALPEFASAQDAGFGRLAAGLYPDGDAAKVALAGCVLLYLFEFDGSRIEAPALSGDAESAVRQLLRWEAVLEGNSVHNDESCRALQQLWLRLVDITDTEEQSRLRNAWRTYSMGAACEASLLAAGTYPTPQEYDVLRQLTISEWPLILITITRGSSLPGDIWSDPGVQALNQLAVRLIGICNDIASCPKETAASSAALNYPTVYAHHDHTTLDGGLDSTRRLYRTLLHAFTETEQRDELYDVARPPLRRYLNDLALLLGGWHRWCAHTPRYQQST
ncbi:terpene synthase family protein [Streptomonospora salina]|uniref:Terpene synthase n=1 Tax=Streptomonospora salina TaxID=104205 RepID=A0A841EKN3_9ACTN|nr:hypothetical protein [Streptomonospora salina]MBB5999971.1 hypothetical protein [Streptomonospora salina]